MSTSRPAKRGELRIYLGAAPGVGKTFAMLGEAHRRLERGTDLVAAVVETHGRRKTAELLDGIEVIPPAFVDYRGGTFAELDVPAIVERRPEVVLVDELAHTNTPGSAHPKRWQDIQDLLDAGITVISTVNVQHLESLNDVVAQITGIEQQETVPDEVVRAADQIELVDITPEALRRRLSHGNVYTSERIDAALSNYFRQGNLTALRELALLWLADQVDAALAKYRRDHDISETWEARERVVVAVTGGTESEALVRRAFRIASKSSAELLVVHVVRGDGLSGVAAPQMGRVREVTASLGATLHTVVGDTAGGVSSALLDFAKGMNATQLVLGTSRRSRWARMFDEGIGARTVQHSGKIDVHMVTHGQAGSGWSWLTASPRHRRLASWLAAVVVPSLICAITVVLLDRFLGIGGESAIFFIGVLVVALLGGVAPAALSALFSGLLLNFFLVEPRYTFTIAEPDSAITVVVLLVVALAVAALVDGAARRALEARRASQEAELLALFAGSVLRGADLTTLLERVRETYSQKAVSLLREPAGVVACVGQDPCVQPETADTAIEVTDERSREEHGSDEEFWLLLSGRKLAARDRRVLGAVAKQAAGLVRQRELTEEAGRAEAIAKADELRRSLLSAVSHDLRTPLAAAKAAVSSLRTDDVGFSAEDTAELLATVEESVDQLTSLVGNLLDSSRLAAGVVAPELRDVYLDEVVHRAILGIPRATFGLERIKVDVGDTVVCADGGLLERVLVNLIDNALRYAPRGLVRVNAGRVGERVLINVVDEGPGVGRGAEEWLFEPFQRLGDHDNTSGVGLGLSVARGFVDAMGGTVAVTDTPGGGLTVVVDLAATGDHR